MAQGAIPAHGTMSVNYNTDSTDTTKASGLHTGWLQVAYTDTATIPALASGGSKSSTVTVTHNLGYMPGVIAFVLLSTQALPLPYVNPGSPSNSGAIQYLVDVASVTSTQITFESISYSGGLTGLNALTIKFYLLREAAT